MFLFIFCMNIFDIYSSHVHLVLMNYNGLFWRWMIMNDRTVAFYSGCLKQKAVVYAIGGQDRMDMSSPVEASLSVCLHKIPAKQYSCRLF